jgi:hypothetical protein
MPVVDLSDRTVPALGAHIAMCAPEGGSNVELMAPADPDQPLSRALLKFLGRRGDGPYALMLEAPDPDAEAAVLAERGVDVLPLMAGAGGRDVHPHSTHGVLIRIYPDDSAPVPRRPAEAPGLSGITRVVVATSDAALAAKAYEHGLGLTVGPATLDVERGVHVATCTPPRGGVIDLVAPFDTDQPFARSLHEHLRDHGEGMYALVLETPEPAAAVGVLGERGLATETGSGRCAVTAFGTRFLVQ